MFLKYPPLQRIIMPKFKLVQYWPYKVQLSAMLYYHWTFVTYSSLTLNYLKTQRKQTVLYYSNSTNSIFLMLHKYSHKLNQRNDKYWKTWYLKCISQIQGDFLGSMPNWIAILWFLSQVCRLFYQFIRLKYFMVWCARKYTDNGLIHIPHAPTQIR